MTEKLLAGMLASKQKKQQKKQEEPQALGRSPENDCLKRYGKAELLPLCPAMNFDKSAVSLRLYMKIFP